MGILETSRRIRRGEVSPVEVLRSCLDRIEAVEGEIGAWVVVDGERALESARGAEAEVRGGRWRGPLHGIPVGVKDIVDVRGIPTRAGSRLLAGAPPAPRDAAVVARLREAGAVILGKTETTEYACFDPARTRNPWNRAHTPGGSSSGSAAAVAAGMCPGSVGSQTGGSISRPAAYCGIVGCKPTHGRVSARGFLPVSGSLDHPGPFAATVADAALMLQAMAGFDPGDPASAPEPVPDFLRHAEDLAPRLGVFAGAFRDQADGEVLHCLEEVCRTLAGQGAPVREIPLPEEFGEVHRAHRTVMCAELAAVHRVPFRARGNEYQAGIRGLIEEGLALRAADYASALGHRPRFRAAVERVMSGLDILLTPAAPTPAPRDLTTTGNPVFNSPWSFAGLPTVVLPAGLARNGMPIGVQLVGHAFGEAGMFRAASWCERSIGFGARPPTL